jgi:hypothetical protein
MNPGDSADGCRGSNLNSFPLYIPDKVGYLTVVGRFVRNNIARSRNSGSVRALRAAVESVWPNRKLRA